MWDTVRNADELVFVCSGNIIRSAFCDIYAHNLRFQKSIRSFATTHHNTELYHKTRDYLKRVGVDDAIINQFSPTHISEFVRSENAVYFVMTREHRQILLENGYPEDRIFLTKEIDGIRDDVLDPYYHGKFDQTLELLKTIIDKLHRYIM